MLSGRGQRQLADVVEGVTFFGCWFVLPAALAAVLWLTSALGAPGMKRALHRVRRRLLGLAFVVSACPTLLALLALPGGHRDLSAHASGWAVVTALAVCAFYAVGEAGSRPNTAGYPDRATRRAPPSARRPRAKLAPRLAYRAPVECARERRTPTTT